MSLCDWSSDVCSSDLSSGATPDFEDSPARFTSTRAGMVSRPAAESESSERSEERRVGKECRSRWSRTNENKKAQAVEYEATYKHRKQNHSTDSTRRMK